MYRLQGKTFRLYNTDMSKKVKDRLRELAPQPEWLITKPILRLL